MDKSSLKVEKDFIAASTSTVKKRNVAIARGLAFVVFVTGLVGAEWKFQFSVPDIQYAISMKNNDNLFVSLADDSVTLANEVVESIEETESDADNAEEEQMSTIEGLDVQPQYILAKEDQVLCKITTANDGLHMRKGPSTSYEDSVNSSFRIPKGSYVTEVGYSDSESNWIVVEYNGYYGWVCVVNTKTGNQMVTPV